MKKFSLNLPSFVFLVSLGLVACSDSGSPGDADGPSDQDSASDGQDDTGGDAPSDVGGESTVEQYLINDSSYRRLLALVVDVLNTREVDAVQSQFDPVVDQLESGGRSLVEGGDAMAGLTLGSLSADISDQQGTSYPVYLANMICDEGGMLEHYISDLGDAPYSYIDYEFDDCQLQGVNYDGGYDRVTGRRTDRTTNFRQFQYRADDRVIAVNGQRVFKYPWTANTEDIVWTDATINLDDSKVVVSNFNWERRGSDSIYPQTLSGFVLDLEGNFRRVKFVTHGAQLVSTFDLVSPATEGSALQVTVDLEFEGNYFIWFNEVNEEPPEYPVSDLGSQLTIYPIADLTSSATSYEQWAKPAETQWQKGGITIAASDGSRMTLSHDALDIGNVEIQLNDAIEPLQVPVTEEFQVLCPTVIDRCGGL